MSGTLNPIWPPLELRDQKFNLFGRELQKEWIAASANGMTLSIYYSLRRDRKMSKSKPN